MTSSQSAAPWIGRSVGEHQRYRLDKHLGGGGMADVFLATDILLGRVVALKLLKERLAVGEIRQRFEQEATLCAALKSDHVVQVSDHGITPEGYPFYIMEYLRGQTLGQLLRREKRLSVKRTLTLATQVCTGLNLAHQGFYFRHPGRAFSEHIKVIHRDLKPDNIFLVPTALGELAKILDFGVAKIRSVYREQTQATNMFLGTYRYAAPEQFEIGRDFDERADIYSLGVILYEMLSGTDPFGFGTNRPLNGVTWAVAHVSKPVLPLCQQPGCESLPLGLEAAILHCLEKAPEQRFASVNELKHALQAVVIGGEAGWVKCPNEVKVPISYSEAKPSDADPFPTSAPNPTPVFAYHHPPLDPDPPPIISSVISSATTRFKFLKPARQYQSTLMLAVGVMIALLLATYHSLQSANSLTVQKLQPEPLLEQSMGLTTPVSTLTGHSDTVWAVAVSPDGKTLVSGSFDQTIRTWNLQTGKLLRVFTGHTDAVRAVAVNFDGKTLVSGSGDKTIKIWDMQTGKLRRTLVGHMGPVWSVAISPDGKTLASGSYDGTIKIWQLQTGKLLRTLPDHYDSIWSVAISPDGKTLASGSYDGTIKIWQLQTGRLLKTLTGHTDAVRSVAISSDGKTLASGSWDKTIKIWDVQKGQLLRTLSGHADRVLSVAISPSGQTIASSSLDRTIKVWNLNTGELRQTLSGHRDWAISVAFAPNTTSIDPARQAIVSGSKDRTIKIWR